MRKDKLKAQMLREAKLGRDLRVCLTLLYRDFSHLSAGTFLIRVSWRVSVSCFVCFASFLPRGFLNVCASVASWMLRIVASAAFPFAARRIHLGRLIRRLYSPTRIITTVCTVPSLVTKLSLRGASEWMKAHKFNSFEYVRIRYTRIQFIRGRRCTSCAYY